MSALSKEYRRQLENTVLKAREEAERGAAAALEAFGVADAKLPGHLDVAGKNLRRKLRAHGRQVGDVRRPDDSQSVEHLIHECAYEHWHRMLFARFLAENGFLIEPESGMDVDLEFCEERARETKSDKWEVAAAFAQRMLPGIFRPDLPAPRPGSGQFCIYVHKCSDDSFYIGQTDDFPRRLSEHEAGKVSWTAPRLPIKPIHWEIFATREEAVKREQDLKTGFGRQWLKREYEKGNLAAVAVRQAGDPVLQVRLPAESRNGLTVLLTSLPRDIFLADDSLGWVYQFWQAKKKEEVNGSGVKIGADELSPATQLFTEDYMVEFLLHNTLGAWWTAKRRADGKNQPLTFTYLRLNEDGSPAAGAFDG